MANPLEGIKKLPTWGKVAIGVGGLGVVYFMYKNHEANASAASSTASTADTGTDPVTGLPYSEDNQVDPATGMTYLAEAQEYGSVSAAESAVAGGASSLGSLGAYDTADTGYPVTGYYDNSGDTLGTTEAYSTNAAWAQAVEAGLSSIGYSSTDVSGAIGRYLSNLSLTSAQATIVYAAIGEYGQPPVGSYQIILQPSTGTSSSGTGTVKVPAVTGDTVNAAHSKLTSAGLAYNADTSKDKPGYSRIVTASNPKAGTSVSKGTHVGLTWHYVKNK